jgi:hypothetical protein
MLSWVTAIAAMTIVSAPIMRAAGGGTAPGEQRRWALDFRVRLEQPGGERPVDVEINGDWVSTISAIRPGEYDAELEIANARVGSGKNAPADATEQLRRRLARPFWATYRDNGALLAIHFFKDVNPSDRNLLQMIATETQLVRPDSGRALWTVLERDGGGSYLAIYQRPVASVVVKRKLKYVHTDGAAGAPADGLRVDVEQSELRFTLDADGGIIALNGSDRVRMGVPIGDAGQLAAITETHLSNCRRSHAPELIGSLAHALPHLVSSPIVTHKQDPEQVRAQLDDRLLEGCTTESLLEAAMAKQKTDEVLSYRLSALFRRRPGAVPAALALLRKSGAQERITDALGSAGSPEAIAALGALARDRTAPRPVRVDALTALIFMPHPRPEVMRVPAALLDDDDARVASAARIASGALARAGRAEHPAEADAIDGALIARYRKAQEVGELSSLLAALGNSIGPALRPVIEGALRDPRAPVRASAARALRLAPGPDIDRLLSATITSDVDPGVRAAAIFATSFRRPMGTPLGEALVRAARTDPVEYVRSDAVSLLSERPDATPDMSETLAWVAEHDAKPGLRRLAQEALASVSR